MNTPSSTYRVQLHKDFNFKDLGNILDYIHDLGISTIYAAPIVKATAGSMHGYDVTDPHMINPEIGTLEEFRALVAEVKKRNMTWLQDIVPNHMAFHVDNYRLMDVLERGQDSDFANYFDIIWNHQSPTLRGKVQVPFLGKPLEESVNDSEIKIGFGENGFTIDYFQTSYPLSTKSYDFLQDKYAILNLPASEGELSQWRARKKTWLTEVVEDDQRLKKIYEAVDRINADRGALKEILDNQYYHLCYWKESEKEIGYRRFFTVNELICLRMEDSDVFDEYHTFLHQLFKEGLIQGIRVDHIDGLRDPATYLQRLRNLFGKECYIIAEKILESKEAIVSDWPLEGTSGYEFLSFASQLMTNRAGAKKLLSFYKDLVPAQLPYHELVKKNKRMILEKYMQGEWDNLVNLFVSLELLGEYDRSRMSEAIASFMISLPVYRIYPDKLPLSGEDLHKINETFKIAQHATPGCTKELSYLQSLFTNVEIPRSDAALIFLQRLMQFTGPLTAKGVEDTTFYVYNALISHDEVGDAPSNLGISINDFHKKMIARQQATPYSLNATATHDTKRGEDARLRLNALCDFPELWIETVKKWMDVNQKFRSRTKAGLIAPTPNDEYYIYQSIVGGYPEDLTVTGEFVERIQAYEIKVLREAKVHSDWANPDEDYEQACLNFIREILLPDTEFTKSVVELIRKIGPLANRYSIAQSLIKITAPGIPDTYQGAGLWDLSFVDPDNRRPVDYQKRKKFLKEIDEKQTESETLLFSYLEDHRWEGVEKMFVTAKALNLRKQYASVFSSGNYIPLQSTAKEAVTVAYARNSGQRWIIIVIPLRAKHSNPNDDLLLADEIILPEGSPSLFKNIFTNEIHEFAGKINVVECCAKFPAAILMNL